MPSVQERPCFEGDVGLVDHVEDSLSYQEACEASLEHAEKFRRGRRPWKSAAEGEVTLSIPSDDLDLNNKECVDDRVQSLFRLVLRRPHYVDGQVCRLTVKVELECVENEGEEVDDTVCCTATEGYDDGIIVKTVLPEGQVERCSVIPVGCSYRQGGMWEPHSVDCPKRAKSLLDVLYRFSAEEQAFVGSVSQASWVELE
jgi:hypothetical protein